MMFCFILGGVSSRLLCVWGSRLMVNCPDGGSTFFVCDWNPCSLSFCEFSGVLRCNNVTYIYVTQPKCSTLCIGPKVFFKKIFRDLIWRFFARERSVRDDKKRSLVVPLLEASKRPVMQVLLCSKSTLVFSLLYWPYLLPSPKSAYCTRNEVEIKI